MWKSILHKCLFVGLVVSWAAAVFVAVLWIISEFQRIEFVINDWQANFLYLEFNAVGGEFYLGCPVIGLYLNWPFFLVVGVLLVWPVIDLIGRVKKSRKRRGFDVESIKA